MGKIKWQIYSNGRIRRLNGFIGERLVCNIIPLKDGYALTFVDSGITGVESYNVLSLMVMAEDKIADSESRDGEREG